MPSLEEKILDWRAFRIFRVWLSSIVLPGFQGVSLYDSLNFFRKEIFSQRFAIIARAISFSFLLSFPPFLLFLFTLIPYLPFSDENLINTIEETVGMVTQSSQLQASVSNLISDFFLHKKEVLLSFSVLMTLFFSSNGMLGLMSGFDRSHAGFKHRVWYKKRALAILLTIIFNGVVIITFAITIFQTWLFNWLGIADWIMVGRGIEYFVIIFILLFIISIIYRYGPSTDNRWPFFTPGSIIATILIVLLTVGFFYSVNNLVNYNEIYGSIGTLIIFLVWLFYMSQILLIGFELNVSIFVNKELHNRAETDTNS